MRQSQFPRMRVLFLVLVALTTGLWAQEIPGQSSWKLLLLCYNHTGVQTLECDNGIIYENDVVNGYDPNYSYSVQTGPQCTYSASHCKQRHPTMGVCTTGKACYIGAYTPRQLMYEDCGQDSGALYSNYIRYNYSCVPVPELNAVSLCSNITVTLPSAHLVSPDFPQNILGGKNYSCRCDITATEPGRLFSLTLKGYYLFLIEQGCASKVEVRDHTNGLLPLSRCSPRSTYFWSSATNTSHLSISFHKTQTNQYGGKFWFGFQASEAVRLSCYTDADPNESPELNPSSTHSNLPSGTSEINLTFPTTEGTTAAFISLTSTTDASPNVPVHSLTENTNNSTGVIAGLVVTLAILGTVAAVFSIIYLKRRCRSKPPMLPSTDELKMSGEESAYDYINPQSMNLGTPAPLTALSSPHYRHSFDPGNVNQSEPVEYVKPYDKIAAHYVGSVPDYLAPSVPEIILENRLQDDKGGYLYPTTLAEYEVPMDITDNEMRTHDLEMSSKNNNHQVSLASDYLQPIPSYKFVDDHTDYYNESNLTQSITQDLTAPKENLTDNIIYEDKWQRQINKRMSDNRDSADEKANYIDMLIPVSQGVYENGADSIDYANYDTIRSENDKMAGTYEDLANSCA